MIRSFIASSSIPFVQELKQSIKLLEIEERVDLILHRPLGLVLSKVAIRFGITPTQITVAGIVVGIIAGILFYQQDQIVFVIWGCFFLFLSGLLDTVDGQVARLTGKTSTLGMIVDGLADNIVFIAAYAGGTFYFIPEYGVSIIFLGATSGFLHSVQSLIFDFYKHEFAFLYGKEDRYRNPDFPEILPQADDTGKWTKKLLILNYAHYLKHQSWFVLRQGKIKRDLEGLSRDPGIRDQFCEKYKEMNMPLMVQWALWGGLNSHRFLIMIFCLFVHFDYYLIFNILMTIPIGIISFLQFQTDRQLIRELARKG